MGDADYCARTSSDVLGRPRLTLTLNEVEVDMLVHAIGVSRRRALSSAEMRDLQRFLERWLDEHPAEEDALSGSSAPTSGEKK